MVREPQTGDVPGIVEIENWEIENGFAHFGLEPITVQHVQMQLEIADRYPWLVAILNEEVAGFCRASPWKARGAYSRTCEVGIYVHRSYQGRGVAKSLYAELFTRLEASGFHTVLAGIALPNPASVRLHESFGMKQVALLPQVGFKLGAWRDTGYWAKVLG